MSPGPMPIDPGENGFSPVARIPYQITFEMKGLPKMTNPSGAKSTHWSVMLRERNNWKQRVLLAVGNHKPRSPLTRARLRLTRYSSFCPDSDGLVSGFKAIIDGLVACKVLLDDRFKNIGMPDYRWEKAKPGAGFVRVEVWER